MSEGWFRGPGRPVRRSAESSALAFLFLAELGGELNPAALVLAKLCLDALLRVQVYGIVAEHPGVVEDRRPDGRRAPPLGGLLVGPARRTRGRNRMPVRASSVSARRFALQCWHEGVVLLLALRTVRSGRRAATLQASRLDGMEAAGAGASRSKSRSTPTGQWSEPCSSGQMKASRTRSIASGEAST